MNKFVINPKFLIEPKHLLGLEWALVLFLAAMVAMLSISVLIIGSDNLSGSLQKINSWTIVICLFLFIWQFTCRCLRWFLFSHSLGISKISFHEMALYYAAGMGMAFTPGRAGEILRLWFLKQRLAVPYRRIAGLYVTDRMGDVIAYLAMLVIGSASYVHGLSLAGSAFLVILPVTILLWRPLLLIKLLTTIHVRLGIGRKVLLWVRRAIRNTSTIIRSRHFIPGVAIGIVGWLAAPTCLSLILSQLGADIDPLMVLLIYAVAALTGGSTLMPGGGGATETVLVLLMSSSNIHLSVAVSAMIVTRLTFFFLPIGLGLLVIPIAVSVARNRQPVDCSA